MLSDFTMSEFISCNEQDLMGKQWIAPTFCSNDYSPCSLFVKLVTTSMMVLCKRVTMVEVVGISNGPNALSIFGWWHPIWTSQRPTLYWMVELWLMDSLTYHILFITSQTCIKSINMHVYHVIINDVTHIYISFFCKIGMSVISKC